MVVIFGSKGLLTATVVVVVLLSKGLLIATVMDVMLLSKGLLTDGRCVVVKRFADRWSLCCQKVC